jgi:hypothetical protein
LDPRYIASGRPQQKTSFRNNSSIVIEVRLPRRCVEMAVLVASMFISAGTCLPNRFLAMNVYSGSAIPAFRRHVTIHIFQNEVTVA